MEAAKTPLYVVYSDKHLGAGPRLPDGTPNRVDDFKGDAQYRRVIEAHLRENPGRPIVLTENGDFVDFQAIPLLERDLLGRPAWRWKEVPTVEAALAKLEIAIAAHPEVFETLRRFLRAHPKNLLRFTIGNHDQAFAWPELQERFKREFGDLADRVAFADFWKDGDVGNFHGAELDPVNRLPDPKDMFITEKKGGKTLLVALLTVLLTYGPALAVLTRRQDITIQSVLLTLAAGLATMMIVGWVWGKIYFRKGTGRVLLNVPYASYMNAGLATELKRRFFPWIGRMQDHGPIWTIALARDWHYALVIAPMLAMHVIYYMFFVDMLSVRRKAGVRTAWRVMASTTHEDQIDEHLPVLVRAHPELRHINIGHTHAAGFWTKTVEGRDVVVRNTGTGVVQVAMRKPEVRIATRWRKTEAFIRRVGYHWRHAPRAALFFTAVHLTAIAALQTADALFGGGLGLAAPIGTAIVAYLLLARQSYALYRGDEFIEWTSSVYELEPDGTASISLRRYDEASDTHVVYGEAPAC